MLGIGRANGCLEWMPLMLVVMGFYLEKNPICLKDHDDQILLFKTEVERI